MKELRISSLVSTWIVLFALVSLCRSEEKGRKQDQSRVGSLEWIRPSDDGTHFVGADSGSRFIVWGVNYDHDGSGDLLEDYWHRQWVTVVDDFREIKALGANVVRIHLQLPKFMDTAEQANKDNLSQLGKLVRLAEEVGLHLDLTGLGCYHKQDVPDWYDALDEGARWDVQVRFWQAGGRGLQGQPSGFLL